MAYIHKINLKIKKLIVYKNQRSLSIFTFFKVSCPKLRLKEIVVLGLLFYNTGEGLLILKVSSSELLFSEIFLYRLIILLEKKLYPKFSSGKSSSFSVK